MIRALSEAKDAEPLVIKQLLTCAEAKVEAFRDTCASLAFLPPLLFQPPWLF